MIRRRVIAAAALSIVLVGWGAAAAQRPLNPPNYYLFELPQLEFGQVVEGELMSSDGQSFKDGAYVDLFAFTGHAGQRMSLLVTSTEFDPYVTLYDREGFVLSANDDQDGMLTDAGLTAELPADGRYLIVVSGYSQYDLGSYAVSLEAQVQSTPEARPLELPVTLRSNLSVDMPAAVDNGLGSSEYFSFAVSEPVMLLATMSSSEFDTVLTLFDETMVQMAKNDDYGPNSDSQLFAKLEPGRYLIAATSYFPGSHGS